tara:strand:+ start:409 stop:843 length:435 start_codon:yes stop_codon:yes gene_type:complete
MTNSDIDIKDPAPVPGIEVHEVPGLLPETETDYLAPETTHPQGFYDPTQVDPDGGINTTEGYVQAPTHPNSEEVHNELLEDPKYAVHVHEAQLNRIIQCLEDIVARINDLDSKMMDLEESVRFSQEDTGNDGPPQSPTGYEGTA